jgi:hypothetical protein
MNAELSSRPRQQTAGEPTPAGPGTEPKIQVMIERAERREPLFHPLDGLPQAQRATLPRLPEPLARLESA